MRLLVLFALSTAAQLPGQTPSTSAAPSEGAARVAYVRDSSAGLSWVLPAHRDWSRYTHPAECIAAMEMVQMTTMHRTNWSSSLVLNDTLSTAARDVGLACAKKFTIANVSSHEWLAFLDLSIRLDNMALAHDIIAEQVSRAKTVDEKASVLADALLCFKAHTPAQVAMADSLLQRMAALGPQARWRRIVARATTPESPVFDTVRDTKVYRDIGTQWRALTRDDRVLAGFILPQLGSGWYAVREYARTDPADICRMMHTELQGLGNDTLQSGPTQAFINLLENDCTSEIEHIGTSAAPLTDTRWFRPGDTVGTSAPYTPVAGHVTLIIPEPVGAGRPSWQQLMYARLAKRFQSQGLDIVLAHRRQGCLWGSGVLAPEQETQLIRWYDHDYLKLPVTVAVYDSVSTTFPRPMLIGRDGRHILGNVVLNSDWRENEYVIAAFIEQALGAPASRPGHSSSQNPLP